MSTCNSKSTEKCPMRLIISKSSRSKFLLTACYLTSSSSVAASASTSASISNIINPIKSSLKNDNNKNKLHYDKKITNSIPRGGARNNEDYYNTLNINKNATQNEIKKAYRRKALETHPDKNNGSRKEFDAISKAYDVLSNNDTKNIYDRFGHAGLERFANGGSGEATGAGSSSGAMHNFAEDIFANFFGGRGSHPGSSFFSNTNQQRRQQSKVKYQIQITLEELYKGSSKHIQLPNNDKVINTNIKPGMKSGDKITLSGEYESSGSGSAPPGDVILIIQQVPHTMYTRKNNDLALRINISFNECINGFTKSIPFLDGTHLTFAYAPTEHDCKELIISKLEYDKSSNEYYYIFKLSGKGMPKNKKYNRYYDDDDKGSNYGDLYIQCNVKLPSVTNNTKRRRNKLTNEERIQLGKLLDKLFHENTATSSSAKNNKVMKLEEDASLHNFGIIHEEDIDDDHDHSFFSDDEEDTLSSHFGHRHSFSFGNMFDHMNQQQQQQHGDNVQCQQM